MYADYAALPEDMAQAALQNNGWIRALVEKKIRKDDETVVVQLHVVYMLCWKNTDKHFPAYNSSLLDIARVDLSRQ